VTNWQTGDTIPIAAGRSLRVVGIIATNENEPPVLIVEAWPKEGNSFSPDFAVFGAVAFAAACHQLRPLGAINAPSPRSAIAPQTIVRISEPPNRESACETPAQHIELFS
jgi:hypothetical protein